MNLKDINIFSIDFVKEFFEKETKINENTKVNKFNNLSKTIQILPKKDLALPKIFLLNIKKKIMLLLNLQYISNYLRNL